MNITVENVEKNKLVVISGRLDAVSSPDADKVFSEILAQNNGNLVIDMLTLDYISSAGLRVMLLLAKNLQAKGLKAVLCRMNENVKDVFDISGFSTIFDIFDDTQSALDAVK